MRDAKIENELSSLRDSLERAKVKLVEQQNLLERLTSPPLEYGILLRTGMLPLIRKRTATVVVGGKVMELGMPENISVNPGDTVVLNMTTLQIVDVAVPASFGTVGYIKRLIKGNRLEVECAGETRVLYNGVTGKPPEKGDRVVVDEGYHVVTSNLGKEDTRFEFSAKTGVTWEDIGGLEEAKRQMIDAVELPFRSPDIFKHYRKRLTKGVLLYGPPGCGKTMLGKATATAIAQIHGSTASSGFLYVKGPEILDRFVGVAESTVRQIFERARKHKQVNNYPAVVFIDEADAILARRGSGISSDIERTIVPMFLTEMDGLEESGALVILATNRADILDPAVVRDGRVDRKVKVERPTQSSAEEIFYLNIANVPCESGQKRPDMAKLGADELFSSKRVLYHVHTTSGTLDFTLGHIVNGGMIVSAVDQATSLALHRDLKKRTRTGLGPADLIAAIDSIEKQNRDLSHVDELADFVHDFKDDVRDIRKVRQGSPVEGK